MKIAVVGAGAAGVFCAANLSEKFEVEIFEAQNKPLKKLLLTGGGRCNFTNENIDSQDPKNFYPRGANNLKKSFRNLSCADVRTLFAEWGVPSKIEDEGRAFPASDDARTIVSMLLKRAARAKISAFAPVERVEKTDGGFRITTPRGNAEFDAVVFACGGKWSGSLKKSLEQMGHKFVPEIPSLFALRCDLANDADWKSGITLDAEISLGKTSAAGALLTTHFGLTGPAALKFSAFAARELAECGYNADVKISFVRSPESLSRFFAHARSTEQKKLLKNFRPPEIPIAFWEYVLGKTGANAQCNYANLSKADEKKISDFLCAARVQILGRASEQGEFVTCGGLSRTDFDFSSMQSRRAENLFALGECLDVDAITGGYNLHAAWATAKTCADFLNKKIENNA